MRESECCDLIAFNGSRDSLLGALTGSLADGTPSSFWASITLQLIVVGLACALVLRRSHVIPDSKFQIPD